MQNQIENILNKELNPEFLEVVNESFKHSVTKGPESHFKVTIVSSNFFDLSKISRHKVVYSLLETEIKLIHALSLALYTPQEWNKNSKPHITPPCSHKR